LSRAGWSAEASEDFVHAVACYDNVGSVVNRDRFERIRPMRFFQRNGRFDMTKIKTTISEEAGNECGGRP
jgi:hypothetical protein